MLKNTLVCWLKDEDIEKLVLLGQKEGWVICDEEILKAKHRFSHLCYGAYDKHRFVGGITGYLHEKSAWIGNFIVDEEYRGKGYGKYLFETALRALLLERQTIYLHASTDAVSFYERYGFAQVVEVSRLLYEGGDIHEKEKSFLKDYQRDDFESIVCSYDKKFFMEDRKEFLHEDMLSKSSLVLSCENGFCHSKAVGKDIMVGGWEMMEGAYLDAERMLRTVISIRGQKNIYADVPNSNSDVISIYENYGFKKVGKSTVMVYGRPLPVQYDNVFAFSSLGSKG
jgi:predicted GNAT family N-acyltransferase